MESNHFHVINILKLKHTFLKQDLADFSAGQLAALQDTSGNPRALLLALSLVWPWLELAAALATNVIA